MAFLVSYLALAFLLVLPFYSSSTDIYHILPHIVPYLLLLSATNSSLLPTLSSSISFYVLLLAHHGVTGLFPPSTSYPLINIPFLFSTPDSLLSATYLFISSTIFTTSLSLLLAIFIFSIISTFSPSITTSTNLQIHCSSINV